MPDRKADKIEQSQLDKFKQAARELETGDDEARPSSTNDKNPAQF